MQELEVMPNSVTVVVGNELPLLLITLLKGVLFQESDAHLWNALVKHQSSVRDYVATLGLELQLDEPEGYAFLRTKPVDATEPDALALPRLMRRHQLSFPVSLLLALLRKKLVEFDTSGGASRLILSIEEIVELVRVFLPEGTNEAKFVNKIEMHLNKIVELGFLRELKSQSKREKAYEVPRIIKAFVDANWLADFDLRLAEYHKHAQQAAGDSSDD